MMSIVFTGENSASFWVVEKFPLVILGVLVLFMIQRKFYARGNKRLATLSWAAMLGALWGGAYLIARYNKPDWLLLLLIGVEIILAIKYKAYVWPFSLKCEKCSADLSLKDTILQETNLCEQCRGTSSENE